MVVGVSSNDNAVYATEWIDGSPINLSPPGDTYSIAEGINNSGAAVGAAAVSGIVYATEWIDGRAFVSPQLPGTRQSHAMAISDLGISSDILNSMGSPTQQSGSMAKS